MKRKCIMCGNPHEEMICSDCLPTADKKLRKLIELVDELENLVMKGKIMIKEATTPEVDEMPELEAFFVKVRQQYDIVDLMSEHRELKRVGDHYICACPVHRGKVDSCRVSPDTQGFYSVDCCGAGGDVIEYARVMRNLSYVEAAYFLAQMVDIPLPHEDCVEG